MATDNCDHNSDPTADNESVDEFALLARDFVNREFPRYREEAQRDPHRYPREL